METVTSVQLLEIEKLLAGPAGRTVMAGYDEQLRSLNVRVGEALRRGLPPEEYAKCRDLPEAVTLARKLLRLQMN